MTARHLPALAGVLALGLALAACTPTVSGPTPTAAPTTGAPTTTGPTVSGPDTCELATGAVQIEVPAEFVREESSCVWDNGDTHLSLTAVVGGDSYDIADHLAEARSYEGVGGDEEVSELRWNKNVELFAAHRGDLLSYRTAADGDPLRIIVGQSGDYQLFYVAPDDGDDGRALFLDVAATVGAK